MQSYTKLLRKLKDSKELKIQILLQHLKENLKMIFLIFRNLILHF